MLRRMVSAPGVMPLTCWVQLYWVSGGTSVQVVAFAWLAPAVRLTPGMALIAGEEGAELAVGGGLKLKLGLGLGLGGGGDEGLTDRLQRPQVWLQ